jgi:hypothetical protein
MLVQSKSGVSVFLYKFFNENFRMICWWNPQCKEDS